MDLSKSYDYFQPEKVRGQIHIVGCGSVGATVAENLVRLGLEHIHLWDFDIVSPHNLANQIFRYKDIANKKVEALADILTEINPNIPNTIKLHPEGWNGERLSGYVFLAVDSIDIRRQIVDAHQYDAGVKAMFDFRTLLEDAQAYAADWGDAEAKKELRDSMNFTHEEAQAETPVSACGVTLGVAPTVRFICTLGVSNFVNYINGHGLRKLILASPFAFTTLAF